MPVNALFAPAVQAVVAALEGSSEVDLDQPTPCTEFSTGELIDHFAGTSAAMARLGRRIPLDPDDPWLAHNAASRGDWRAQLRQNLSDLPRAWADDAAWDGTVDLGGSEMPAAMIGEMALIECLLHGWDLARATGRTLEVSEDVGAELLRVAHETADQGRAMEAYGPEVEVPVDASAFDRALGVCGRNPGWSAAS